MAELLADSYAFIAGLEGNDRYRRILARRKVVTTAMNVLEVHAYLLRKVDGGRALETARALLVLVVEVPPETALRAAEFRHRMSALGRKCSYIDAWGYAAAAALGRRFLTGDPAFKGLENVEFVR